MLPFPETVALIEAAVVAESGRSIDRIARPPARPLRRS